MDYFQGVVTEYLRADRRLFVNTEYCIQIKDVHNPGKGEHWYCDALALEPGNQTVYLCEISYSKTLQSLQARLGAWHEHWMEIQTGIIRDSCLPDGSQWKFRAWLFTPADRFPTLKHWLGKHAALHPRVTDLETVLPWKYPSWNRPFSPCELVREQGWHE